MGEKLYNTNNTTLQFYAFFNSTSEEYSSYFLYIVDNVSISNLEGICNIRAQFKPNCDFLNFIKSHNHINLFEKKTAMKN